VKEKLYRFRVSAFVVTKSAPDKDLLLTTRKDFASFSVLPCERKTMNFQSLLERQGSLSFHLTHAKKLAKH